MTRLLLSLTFAFALTLTGCQSTGGGETDNPAGAPVNTACPMMTDHDADADHTVVFEGMVIGFCCDSCVEEFTELTRDDQLQKLRDAGVDI